MKRTIRLGVSSCLLGNPVRYDGGHKLDRYLRDMLGRFVEWVPVCPEVEFGLGVPREPMRLVGDRADPRLVTRTSGLDHTGGMKAWAARRLEELARADLCGFVFKSRSPSSGMRRVMVYGAASRPAPAGAGIFARAVMARFPGLPVEDEERLQDPDLRENFIERVFVWARWREGERRGGAGWLDDFHATHRYLLLAHSPAHYARLGAIVAASAEAPSAEVRARYLGILMEGLRLSATVRKHTIVLRRIAGSLGKRLAARERAELQETIAAYRRGLAPHIVPITLLAHFARRNGEPHLRREHYLHPDPRELMLRTHA